MKHDPEQTAASPEKWTDYRCRVCCRAFRIIAGTDPLWPEDCTGELYVPQPLPEPAAAPTPQTSITESTDARQPLVGVATQPEQKRRNLICAKECTREQQRLCAPATCDRRKLLETGTCPQGKWYLPQTTQQQCSARVDIIVPTYRNEQLTAACFRSIRKNTEPGSYRLIWVDNGSGDLSIPLAELSGVNFILIELAANRGFVDAVNEGLRVSDRELVCLLNNDTEVSSRWLEKLEAALKANDKLGIVGPFTAYQTAGMDSHHCLTLHDTVLPPEAIHWDLETINRGLESRHAGKIYPISFVAFLCALIRREVIDKVGFLDANYTLGMYDDTDYNRAAQQAGFEVGLSLDTCIYHRGRSTFQLLEKDGLNVSQLLLKNKAYLDGKWGKR